MNTVARKCFRDSFGGFKYFHCKFLNVQSRKRRVHIIKVIFTLFFRVYARVLFPQLYFIKVHQNEAERVLGIINKYARHAIWALRVCYARFSLLCSS